MLCVYDSKCTDFNNNGLVVLDSAITAFFTEELNGQYELELEYPLDERGKWQYLIEGNILKAEDQLFRIFHKVKNLASIKINARHIFYDLLDNFLEDCRPTNQTGYGAIEWILTHTQYSHDFTSVGDVAGSYTRYFIRKNPVEAIMGTDGIISTWGGELVRDNFTIRLLQARGQDRGVLIAYGKNIVGIEETLDIDGICTRIMPIGKDGLLLSEKYIDSQYINNFPHPKVQSVEFNDIENETDLRKAAQDYFITSKCDIPQFNYKVDFIELSKTEEYKHYAILETVFMGDTVTIKHSKLNISLKAKVIKIVKNCITKRIEKVELGSFKPNLASGINNSIQSVKSEIINTKSNLQTAIDNATTQINSALGGYVVKRNGELLIMDTEDINTATKVWRWSQGGLGYSGTGYNGEFRTAITADGHIVADFMDTGILDANKVTVNNLVVGTNVSMGNATISWDNVTNQPFIPTTASDIGAMPSDADISYTILKDKPYIPLEYTDTKALAAWAASGYATYIDANGVYTGTMVADRIIGGTLSGITIDIDTDATIGNRIMLGGSSGLVIENNYGFKVKVYNSDILRFYSNALFCAGGLSIASGYSIGVSTGSISSPSYSGIITMWQNQLNIFSSGSGGTTNLYGYVNIRDRVGFFGTYPEYKHSVDYPSNIVTNQSPSSTYSSYEQGMLNSLKSDVSTLRTELYNLISALKSYGLV